jgi:hypothetical protein
MANKAHLFEDLRINKDKGQVDGISEGLEIVGKGTFKFNIKDDGGRQHNFKPTWSKSIMATSTGHSP